MSCMLFIHQCLLFYFLGTFVESSDEKYLAAFGDISFSLFRYVDILTLTLTFLLISWQFEIFFILFSSSAVRFDAMNQCVYICSVLTQRVLAHPYIAFRNQCQLNNRMDTGYKLMPWSTVRPMMNIYRNQVFVQIVFNY